MSFQRSNSNTSDVINFHNHQKHNIESDLSDLSDLSESTKTISKKRKYFYADDRTFQVALRYFNTKWQKQVKKNKKKEITREQQEIYVEKVGINQGKQCKRCLMELTGVKYFVNENKPSQILCHGCLGRKLEKEVGTDEQRILEEMRWLKEKDLLPLHMVSASNTWTFSNQ